MADDQTTREKPLTITINPAMVPMLRGLARRNGRLVEWTVHEAIRRWLHEETAALHVDDDKEAAKISAWADGQAPKWREADFARMRRTVETQRRALQSIGLEADGAMLSAMASDATVSAARIKRLVEQGEVDD